MLKEDYILFKSLMIIIDLCIACVAFFMGYYLKSGFVIGYEPNIIVSLLPVFLFIWGILLYYFGMYESLRTRQIIDVLLMVGEASFLGYFFLGAFIFITKIHTVSRAHIFYSFLLTTLFVCIEKIAIIIFFRYQRRKGYNTRNLLIVGTGKRAQQFIGVIDRHAEWGFNIIGLADDDIEKGTQVCGYIVMGSLKDIPDIIHNNVVDEIICVYPRSRLKDIEDIVEFVCNVEGIKVSVVADLLEPKFAKVKFSHIVFDNLKRLKDDPLQLPLITFERTPDNALHLLLKRLFDLFSSVIAIGILFPLFVIISIIIKTSSKGPIFFRQHRCSLHGRKFILYKFRTMVEDAEMKLNNILKYNEMDGPVFKMTNDPRVTKVGKYLRKYSIDELPQLWNVLKGDMSLVGPRPPLPAEVSKYESWQRRRLSMRPGITCLWQASGRNKINNFDAWANLDMEYIDRWSLWLDFKILLKTLPAVFYGKGAK